METVPSRHVLLAGGGSGGHVFPALAVGAELAARGWSVSFAGSQRGLEERLVTAAGVPFFGLPARPVLGKGRLAQARAGATLVRSALAARRLVRRLDARAVVGAGGFASVPGVLGGRLARRPVLLVETNVAAGAATRWLARCAREAAVAWPETGRRLSCPAVVTGVPVRRAFFEVPVEPPPGPPRLLLLGGSQGALQLNRLLPAAVARLGEAARGLAITHQCGGAHRAAAEAAWAAVELPGVEVTVVPFIDDVAGAMAASHLVLSRAGAIASAEICAAGRPALLVPLAIAGGHQRHNARALAEAGAAVMLEPEGAPGATPPAADAAALAAALEELLGDRQRLAAMGRTARALARPEAAAAIADRVEALGGGR